MNTKVYLSYPFFNENYEIKFFNTTRAELITRCIEFVRNVGPAAVDKYVERALTTKDRIAIPAVPKCVALCGGNESFLELDGIFLSGARTGGTPFLLFDGDGRFTGEPERADLLLDSVQYCAGRACSEKNCTDAVHPMVKENCKDFIFYVLYSLYDWLLDKTAGQEGKEAAIRLVIPVPTVLFDEIHRDFKIMADHYITYTAAFSRDVKEYNSRDVGISFYPFKERNGRFVFDVSYKYNKLLLKSVYGIKKPKVRSYRIPIKPQVL